MTTVSRLIHYFTPETYTLNIDLMHAHDRTFKGTVTIVGRTAPESDRIVLHAKKLTINSVTINGQSASFVTGDNDELTLTHNSLSADAKHTVTIAYSGTITDHMHGLYPCYYTHDGVKKELYATQFESHHAREVFPCVDEPEAKATFQLTIVSPVGQKVLSNMPATQQITEGDSQRTSFDITPRMSTYLLAFVVGELHNKSGRTKDGVDVSIWSTPAQPKDSLDFALDTAIRAIEFYDGYFGTAYPLPKSDHVALPDFSAGAMENWGLITYRESCLLANTRHTSIQNQHYIATVITHELAHQWFGNLVTMKWWDDLWLNESFANLMEYICVDAIYPDWNIWLDYVTREPVLALRRDSIDGVQPVHVGVNHPDEISTLFDGAIVYAKGGRLLRMIQQYIGSDAFRAGLKSYFVKYAYSNTTGEDLWNELETASGKHIGDIMNTWISQPGYPLVTVKRDDDSLTLTQERFFVGPHEPSTSLWPIPLNAASGDLPPLMQERSIVVTTQDPVQLNLHESSHFITLYDKKSWAKLLEGVANMSLDPITRIQLLDETSMLTRGGAMHTAELLPLLTSYRSEKLEPVWSAMAGIVSELKKFVEDDSDAEMRLRAFSADLAKVEYDRLGWSKKPGESEEDTKLRSVILSLSLFGENPDALKSARELYESVPLSDIDPELRGIIIGSVVRHGDAKIVDDLLEIYKSTPSVDLKRDICSGVSQTIIPEKIEALLSSLKDPAVIRPQDVFKWFIYLIRGKESRAITWAWTRDNWDWVVATFEGDKSYDDFPRYAASGLVTSEQLQEYKDFFLPKASIPALTRTITMGISEIEGRVALIERDKAGVQQALRKL